MKAGVRRRTACRLCAGRQLDLVVPFIPTPIADDYVPKECVAEVQETFPLDLHFCRDCGHVQLLDVVDPALLFRKYTYQSGSSPGLVRHFLEYAEMVLKRVRPPEGSLIVDIGSNDGALLRFFQEKGYRVLGIDPAREIARKATEAGIETLPDFFTPETAKLVRSERGLASVLTANNVFAHADDLAGMVDGIRELLAPDGLFVFEASYLVDVVDKMLLGTIFHEHLCYHTVGPLRTFLARHGLELVGIERVSIQGGSIIGFAQRSGGPLRVMHQVEQLVTWEQQRGFDRPEIYRSFADRINAFRSQVRSLLQEIKSSGLRIAGFGAARGGTTMIYHFGLGEFLEYLVDDSQEKHHLFSPGLHIPVLPSQEIYKRRPDYLFLLAWVHAKPILERHRGYREQGGRFIVPFPTIEVV